MEVKKPVLETMENLLGVAEVNYALMHVSPRHLRCDHLHDIEDPEIWDRINATEVLTSEDALAALRYLLKRNAEDATDRVVDVVEYHLLQGLAQFIRSKTNESAS